MLDLYYRKSQHIYAAKFYEWRKVQLSKRGMIFENYDRMQNRIQETKRLHKFMYDGLENTVYISRRLSSAGKSPKERKKDKIQKKATKDELIDYSYKKDNDILLNLPTPPFFFYIPQKIEMQLLIKRS
mmetsp:Transcript_16636/g.14537  ORF Transcript_16636/g.14537 Transcript_16636/m.14537 type:complete len:128 (+) Transcript_16636:734-1117(+)